MRGLLRSGWLIAVLGAAVAGCVPPPQYGAPAYAAPGYGVPAYGGPGMPYPAQRPVYGGYASYPPPLPYQAPPRPRAMEPAPRSVARAPAPSPRAAPAPEAQATAKVEAPAAPAAGPECRSVTQLGYVDGKEVQRQDRYCRAGPGRDWVRS